MKARAYTQLEKDLLRDLHQGVLRPGDLLPAETALAQKYGISRTSVRTAIASLVEQGMLERRQGAGTFVAGGALSTHRALTISLVVPDINDPFIAAIGSGIAGALGNQGTLLIQSSNGSSDTENANLEYIVQTRLDGAIVFPNWGVLNLEALARLKLAGIPFVLVDRHFPGFAADSVTVDNFGGAFQATTHLVSLGHRRIAHLQGTDCSANHDRRDGFLAALAEADLPCYPHYLLKMDAAADRKDAAWLADRFEPDRQWGLRNTLRLMELPHPPTAIFAGNDFQALGAIEALRQLGRRIPEEISVCGFDGLTLGRHFPIPLTTIAQPANRIGEEAMRLLLRRIRGDHADFPRQVVLDTTLVVRDSTAEPLTSPKLAHVASTTTPLPGV